MCLRERESLNLLITAKYHLIQYPCKVLTLNWTGKISSLILSGSLGVPRPMHQGATKFEQIKSKKGWIPN